MCASHTWNNMICIAVITFKLTSILMNVVKLHRHHANRSGFQFHPPPLPYTFRDQAHAIETLRNNHTNESNFKMAKSLFKMPRMSVPYLRVSSNYTELHRATQLGCHELTAVKLAFDSLCFCCDSSLVTSCSSSCHNTLRHNTP